MYINQKHISEMLSIKLHIVKMAALECKLENANCKNIFIVKLAVGECAAWECVWLENFK